MEFDEKVKAELKSVCKENMYTDYQSILNHYRHDADMMELLQTDEAIKWLMWLMGF